MNLIEKLTTIYPNNIPTLEPSYKAEKVGMLLHANKYEEVLNKRTGKNNHKFSVNVTIFTKDYFAFSSNFTIKIDESKIDEPDKSISTLAYKIFYNPNEKDFCQTEVDPVNKTLWRILGKSYSFWKISQGAGNWLSGVVSYDLGREFREQIPSLLKDLVIGGTNQICPSNKNDFIDSIEELAFGIFGENKKTVSFDPNLGISLYRVEYENTSSVVSDDNPKSSKPKIVTYPRGANDIYYARNIMGHIDVELLRKFREESLFCQLSGSPGCGKTSLVEAAFGDELLTANGNGDYSSASFIGEWTINVERNSGNPNEFAWTDGILCRAMKEGRPLLIDEATLLPSHALDAIHSATDGRGYIDLDEFPGKPRIHAKKGFYVIMAYNPHTLHGREIPEAIRSRFGVVLNVATDYNALDHFEIPSNMRRVAVRMNNVNQDSLNKSGRGVWVPQMRELLNFKKLVNSGLSEEFAFNNLVGLCPEMFREQFIQEIHAVTNIYSESLSLGGLVNFDEPTPVPVAENLVSLDEVHVFRSDDSSNDIFSRYMSIKEG